MEEKEKEVEYLDEKMSYSVKLVVVGKNAYL